MASRARRGVGPRQKAKVEVAFLLESYLGLLDKKPETARGAADSAERAGTSGTLQLISRTAQVLHSFTDAVHVVVEMSRERGTSALSVHVPARRLRPVGQTWLRQRATLGIDLLAPSSQTPRDVRVDLPVGLSCHLREGPDNGSGDLIASIEVLQPEPLIQLNALMDEVLAPGTDDRIRLCLADLALEKVPAVRELFRSHQLVVPAGRRDAGQISEVVTPLDALDTALTTYTDADPATLSPGPPQRVRQAWLPDGEPIDGELHWLQGDLYRKTTDETLSTRAVHLHVEGVDQAGLRPAPVSAQVSVTVALSDSPLFSAARYAGLMSLALMLSLLFFSIISASKDGDAQVLASALTIFAAITATRVEYPDRTTLKGRLSSWGYAMVGLSVLPAIVLAIGLAFRQDRPDGMVVRNGPALIDDEFWALASALPGLPDHRAQPAMPVVNTITLTLGAIGLQLLVIWILHSRFLYHRPVSPALVLQTEPTPDHRRSSPLQSAWWKGTTAEALRLGRTAHAYLTWKQNDGGSRGGLPEWWRAPMASPTLRGPNGPSIVSVVDATIHALRGENPATPAWKKPSGEKSPEAANILSLVQAGTTGRSVTFFVFREEPLASWLEKHDMITVPLRPDLLAPTVTPVDHVNVFLGMLQDDETTPVSRHPLAMLIHRAEQKGLPIEDAQLPVPPPPDAPPGLRWARLQIALQAGDTPDLGAYLTDLANLASDPLNGCQALIVQPGLQLRSRILVNKQPGRSGRSLRSDDDQAGWLPAQRLDITAAEPDRGERSWLAIAITANARPGIEDAVIDWLGEAQPGLVLRGLIMATLHGTSVLFLVVQRKTGPLPAGDGWPRDLEEQLARKFTNDHLKAAVRPHKAAELGYPASRPPVPLLHVHLRAKDRPGLVAGLIDGVNKVITEMASAPISNGGPGLSPWYALLQVVEGGTARARFTLRIPDRLSQIADWPAENWETAEQTIRRVISGENGTDPSWRTNLDSTVLNLEIVRDWASGGPPGVRQ